MSNLIKLTRTMNKMITFSEKDAKYVNAFIKVAKQLEPSANLNDVIINKHEDDETTDIEISVCGRNGRIMTKVTRENRPNIGDQIVIRKIDLLTMKVIKERCIWYFSFNWAALIATE